MSVARVPFLLGLSLVAVYAGGGAARAADGSGRQLTGQWAFCGAPLTPPPAGDPATREAPDTATTIDAGSVRYDAATGRYTFLGRPVLSRADQRLEADRLEYDEGRQRAEASGGFRYDEAGVVMKGDRGTYDLDDNTGQFSQVSYRVEAGHLHGEADSVDVESESRTRYRNVTLTTCNPGEEDWWLHAGEVTIDTQEREGVAYNAWLSFWHVPLFYTPYISFPVGSGRKTGFLAPNIGNSDTGGASLSTPYYLNLAPNYDDTITPTVYARRGLMLSNEFRYLTRSLSGEIRGSYLPDDQAYGEDRWSIMQRHRLALGQHFRGELLQQRVSDTDYLGDFSTRLDESAESNLESRVSAGYAQQDWTLSADAQSWQTVDPNISDANLPYARRPRLQFLYDPLEGIGPLRPTLETEAVEFVHPEKNLVDTGSRVDIKAGVSAPLRAPGYFFVPSVAWEHTQYNLDRPDPALPETPQRALPIYSVDSGIVLERNFTLGGQALRQTLEPRLFYLYVPERDQNELPRFDTTSASFSFSSLYDVNRFTGPDRIGDANQLTTGLTSRVLDGGNGREYLSVSAGQIFYFADRQVTLRGTAPETRPRSDIITELNLSLPAGLSVDADYQFNPDESGNDDLRTRFQWKGSRTQVVNLDYRVRRSDGERSREEAEFSFATPVLDRWQVVGGWSQDLLNDRVQERFAGLQYDSCCYALRAVYRSYLVDRGDAEAALTDQAMLQLELKGLGGVGDKIIEFLNDAVRGYNPPQY